MNKKIVIILALLFYYPCAQAMKRKNPDTPGLPSPDLSGMVRTNCHFLCDAASEGRLQDVQRLIAEGVDVNYMGSDGITALYEASCWGHLAVVNVLINNGADVNKGRVSKPLHGASSNGRFNIVQALVARQDIDIDSLNQYGYTALFCAALAGHPNIVLTLLGREASFSANYDGLTPADIAGMAGHPYIEAYLRRVMQERRARRVAFLMARHSRFGADSPAQVLPREIFSHILSFRGM